MMQKCTQPPVGWRCTRDKGHEGPCAAYPLAVPSTGCTELREEWGVAYTSPDTSEMYPQEVYMVIRAGKAAARRAAKFTHTPWKRYKNLRAVRRLVSDWEDDDGR